jgi:oligosaccharide reducing-end xylanase
MSLLRIATLTAALMLPALSFADGSAAAPSFQSGQYRNLFAEWLGKSEEEVTAKLNAVWHQFAEGDADSQRLFYAGADGTYIPDVMHDDVRTEGQSYGMMLAVQMNHQEEFDRLWKWTRRFMYHPDGPFAGYYAWHCRYDGTQIHAGPASDGEEWFVMTLFFAAHRWGTKSGAFDYEKEAQTLLRHMLHNNEDGSGVSTPMFDRTEKQIVFVPHKPGNKITDPSYHLPAFYELWAKWATDPADRTFFAEAAQISRQLFRNAAHPITGLMPDYAHFDGKPFARQGHESFLYDAYRVISNVAVDYAWFGRDPWQVEQSRRIVAFLAAQGDSLVDLYTLEGKPLTQERSPGLSSMAATAALAVDTPEARLFVKKLWEMPVPSGRDRYYHGLLYFLALLQTSGHYRIYHPASS